MKTFKWNDAQPLQVPFDAKRLLQSKQADLVHLHLKPGQDLAPHGNDVDMIFYVLGGEGILTVNGETDQLGCGDSVFIEKDAQRRWQPTDPTEGITLLAVKLHENRSE